MARKTASIGRRLAGLALCMALAGCAARPGGEQLHPVAAAPAGSAQVGLLAVTNRSPEGEGFGRGRGGVSYRAYDIAVAPPPAGGSRPRKLAEDFAVTASAALTPQEFLRRSRRSGSTIVFVHGFNHRYPEALFRLAQISVDSGTRSEPVLFSWPSAGSVRAYLGDRDAAAFAREDLAGLLEMLARNGPRDILLVGHSMGAWLVMETLRDLGLEGRSDVLRRLRVGLAAPDIDLDVFRRQMAAIGGNVPSVTVLAASDDRALSLSARLAGGAPRLGALYLGDPRLVQLVAETGIRVVDITDLPSEDSANHSRFLVLAGRTDPAETGSALSRRFDELGLRVLDAPSAVLAMPSAGR